MSYQLNYGMLVILSSTTRGRLTRILSDKQCHLGEELLVPVAVESTSRRIHSDVQYGFTESLTICSNMLPTLLPVYETPFSESGSSILPIHHTWG